MPSSYQAPLRKDKERSTTYSQSEKTNISLDHARVQNILDAKGTTVFSVHPDNTLKETVQILSQKRIGALLVLDAQDALIGIISERDIIHKLAETPGETLPKRVKEVMTSDVETCAADETLISVMHRMTEGRFRHMPVTDNSGVIGIVTIGDVVNNRLTELEHEALQLKQLIVG